MKIAKKYKIILDVIMTLVLTLLYSKNVLGLKFHEVAGLGVFGLFLIHNIFNWSWIKVTTKNIVKGAAKNRAIITYIIFVLITISMILTAVSGVIISKTILTNINSSNFSWRFIHTSSATISLILLGVHLALNWNGIKAKISILKSKSKIKIGIIKIAFILIIASGATYGFLNSSYLRNLNSTKMLFVDMSNISIPHRGPESGSEIGRDLKRTIPRGGNFHHGGGISPSNIIKTIIQYTMIFGIFTTISYYIIKFISKLSRKRVKA